MIIKYQYFCGSRWVDCTKEEYDRWSDKVYFSGMQVRIHNYLDVQNPSLLKKMTRCPNEGYPCNCTGACVKTSSSDISELLSPKAEEVLNTTQKLFNKLEKIEELKRKYGW